MVAPTAISSECRSPSKSVPPQPTGAGESSSTMPAAEAGRKDSISFAPGLLALSAGTSSRRQACVDRPAGGRGRQRPVLQPMRGSSVRLRGAAVNVEIEVFLRDLVIFAVGADRLDAGVDLLFQIGVFLAHPGADARSEHFVVRGHHALEIAAGLTLVGLEELLERDGIGLYRVEAARGEVVVSFVLRLVFLDLGCGGAEMLLGVDGMHRRHLDADDLALEIVGR